MAKLISNRKYAGIVSVLLLGALMAGLLVTCDKGTEPKPKPVPFSLRINVQIMSGHPSGFLRVSAWNKIADNGNLRMSGYKSAMGDESSKTSFTFALPCASQWNLAIRDLAGQTVVEFPGESEAGVQTVFSAFDDEVHSGVYRYILTATASGGSSSFVDTGYAVLQRGPDPERTVIGYTGGQDYFETHDSLLFPRLFALPNLIQTDSLDSDPIGSFNFSDSIVIVLTDTATHVTESFERAIGHGKNEMTLTWDPLGAAKECPPSSGVDPVTQRNLKGSMPPETEGRGDIDCNTLAYEASDADMLTGYFLEGLAAFGDHQQCSIDASDVNADGIFLSVADLVYLVRIILEDTPPFPNLPGIPVDPPEGIPYSYYHDTLSFEDTTHIGGVCVVAQGNVTPVLLAVNMAMQYHYNGTNTRIIIYPPYQSAGPVNSFTGACLKLTGNISQIEISTASGTVVQAHGLPENFELYQNYPNPFN